MCIRDSIEDVLNVLAGQLVQPQPDGFSGLRLLADALGLPWTAVHLHNVVQQLLQLVGVVPLGKSVNLQAFPELLPYLCFHLVKIRRFVRDVYKRQTVHQKQSMER